MTTTASTHMNINNSSRHTSLGDNLTSASCAASGGIGDGGGKFAYRTISPSKKTIFAFLPCHLKMLKALYDDSDDRVTNNLDENEIYKVMKNLKMSETCKDFKDVLNGRGGEDDDDEKEEEKVAKQNDNDEMKQIWLMIDIFLSNRTKVCIHNTKSTKFKGILQQAQTKITHHREAMIAANNMTQKQQYHQFMKQKLSNKKKKKKRKTSKHHAAAEKEDKICFFPTTGATPLSFITQSQHHHQQQQHHNFHPPSFQHNFKSTVMFATSPTSTSMRTMTRQFPPSAMIHQHSHSRSGAYTSAGGMLMSSPFYFRPHLNHSGNNGVNSLLLVENMVQKQYDISANRARTKQIPFVPLLSITQGVIKVLMNDRNKVNRKNIDEYDNDVVEKDISVCDDSHNDDGSVIGSIDLFQMDVAPGDETTSNYDMETNDEVTKRTKLVLWKLLEVSLQAVIIKT